MKYMSFLLALCGALVALGQEPDAVSWWRVKLNGGTVLSGIVVSSADTGLVLQLPEGIEVAIPTEKILGMTLERGQWQLSPSGKRIFQRGPLWQLGFHLLGGSTAGSNSATMGVGFSIARLHQLSHGWQLGGGLQLSLLDDVFLPVFAEIKRMAAPKKDVGLYGSMRLGYGLPIAEYFDGDNGYTYHGGAFVQPAVGLRLAQRWHKSLQLEAGFMWQYSERHLDWWWEDILERIWYRRVLLSVHWAF